METLKLCLHITRRNWLVYKKDFLANISPTFTDPIFFILSLGLGLGAFVKEIDGKTYLNYIAPGLAASSAMMTSFFETSYGFYVRMTFENVFKAMLTTPIGISEIVMGEFIWVALKGAFMTVGVSIVLSFFGSVQYWWTLPCISIVGIFISLSCGAIGLISCSLVRNINQFQSVYSFFISPIFFFSGIFFPLDDMPPIIRMIAYLLPLSHGVKLTQSFFWNENIAHSILVHGSALLVQSLVFCLIANVLLKRKLQN